MPASEESRFDLLKASNALEARLAHVVIARVQADSEAPPRF